MPAFDLPLDELRDYLPQRHEPPDFDDFWARTLAETRSRPLGLSLEPVDVGLRSFATWDVTFAGFGGDRVHAWYVVPRWAEAPVPCVVEFIGYGGGRGMLVQRQLWASAGFAHFVMDNRSMGDASPSLDHAAVPEAVGPHARGFVTLGIERPDAYFYRRLFTDAVRALEAARLLPMTDPARTAAYGWSQGGGIALAVAGLLPDLPTLVCNVPFLCHIGRATRLVNSDPYAEIVRYLRTHRDAVEQTFNTLSYFDGMQFAVRARARALFSVGLMDEICPPSSVYAAYNHYRGPKAIHPWPFAGHDGGGPAQEQLEVRWLHDQWDAGSMHQTATVSLA